MLSTFPPLKKLPFSGLDFRQVGKTLASEGQAFADRAVTLAQARLRPAGLHLAPDHVVILLGGSSGLMRQLALQLVLAERVAVFIVHFDSKRLQIGPYHLEAMRKAVANEAYFSTENADGSDPGVVNAVVEELGKRFRVAHLINGIAAGAPKRSAQYGPSEVLDLDVGFDPLGQVADFSQLRGIGRVTVEVASQEEEQKTLRTMGESTALWAQALSEAKLLVKHESLVAFADYDFAADDPVYAKGPLATAKRRQRDSLTEIASSHGPRTARWCYPPMNTTALSAIPGGLLAFAASAEILFAHEQYQTIAELAFATVQAWADASRSPRFDDAYQARYGEILQLIGQLTPDDYRQHFATLLANSARL